MAFVPFFSTINDYFLPLAYIFHKILFNYDSFTDRLNSFLNTIDFLFLPLSPIF